MGGATLVLWASVFSTALLVRGQQVNNTRDKTEIHIRAYNQPAAAEGSGGGGGGGSGGCCFDNFPVTWPPWMRDCCCGDGDGGCSDGDGDEGRASASASSSGNRDQDFVAKPDNMYDECTEPDDQQSSDDTMPEHLDQQVLSDPNIKLFFRNNFKNSHRRNGDEDDEVDFGADDEEAPENASAGEDFEEYSEEASEKDDYSAEDFEEDYEKDDYPGEDYATNSGYSHSDDDELQDRSWSRDREYQQDGHALTHSAQECFPIPVPSIFIPDPCPDPPIYPPNPMIPEPNPYIPVPNPMLPDPNPMLPCELPCQDYSHKKKHKREINPMDEELPEPTEIEMNKNETNTTTGKPEEAAAAPGVSNSRQEQNYTPVVDVPADSAPPSRGMKTFLRKNRQTDRNSKRNIRLRRKNRDVAQDVVRNNNTSSIPSNK